MDNNDFNPSDGTPGNYKELFEESQKNLLHEKDHNSILQQKVSSLLLKLLELKINPKYINRDYFEKLVIKFLEFQGYILSAAGDGQNDIEMYKGDDSTKRNTIIRCTFNPESIDAARARKFIGSLFTAQAVEGIYVTTGSFSADAIKCVEGIIAEDLTITLLCFTDFLNQLLPYAEEMISFIDNNPCVVASFRDHEISSRVGMYPVSSEVPPPHPTGSGFALTSKRALALGRPMDRIRSLNVLGSDGYTSEGSHNSEVSTLSNMSNQGSLKNAIGDEGSQLDIENDYASPSYSYDISLTSGIKDII